LRELRDGGSPFARCSTWFDRCGTFLRSQTFHRWALLVWVGLSLPAFTIWLDSVPWVNFMSYYAILISHAAALEAAAVKETTEVANGSAE
jgi:hypothetical protein